MTLVQEKKGISSVQQIKQLQTELTKLSNNKAKKSKREDKSSSLWSKFLVEQG